MKGIIIAAAAAAALAAGLSAPALAAPAFPPQPAGCVAGIVTTGRQSLVRIARENGTGAAQIILATGECRQLQQPALWAYLNRGDLRARMPRGISLWVEPVLS